MNMKKILTIMAICVFTTAAGVTAVNAIDGITGDFTGNFVISKHESGPVGAGLEADPVLPSYEKGHLEIPINGLNKSIDLYERESFVKQESEHTNSFDLTPDGHEHVKVDVSTGVSYDYGLNPDGENIYISVTGYSQGGAMSY